MTDLSAHQQAILKAHFNGDDDEASKLIIASELSGTDRLSIYRNNTFITLTDALGKTFRVVQKLVGRDFFNYCAREFIKKHPPQQGPLFEYGDEFADFLVHFEPAGSLPYLADVAQLEWLINLSYHAANIQALVASDLSIISEEEFQNITLTLHPSCHSISSDFPIHEIWAFNQNDIEHVEIDFAQGSELIILRQRLRVELQPVNMATIVFLQHLNNGKTLGQSFSAATAEMDDFDPVSSLLELLTLGVFSEFQLPANKIINPAIER